MFIRCNSTYRLRYWNVTRKIYTSIEFIAGCNSTYRLRYWNRLSEGTTAGSFWALQQYLPFTVLKHTINWLSKCGKMPWSCNSTYRLRYWNSRNSCRIIYSIFVATVLTVYGIETILILLRVAVMLQLQQYLPFTVLKLNRTIWVLWWKCSVVATVLTVYGIETCCLTDIVIDICVSLQQYLPFTVLKQLLGSYFVDSERLVATVLTVYGIETINSNLVSPAKICCNSTYRLRYWNVSSTSRKDKNSSGCNSTYRLRYWNFHISRNFLLLLWMVCCNSTYRLRYWNRNSFLIIISPDSVATVLTVYGIETRTITTTLGQPLYSCNSTYRLRYWNLDKQIHNEALHSCNSTYRLRYWNSVINPRRKLRRKQTCCNSTYRLRYWNLISRIKLCSGIPVATVLTVYGIETVLKNNLPSQSKKVATVLTVYGIETRTP